MESYKTTKVNTNIEIDLELWDMAAEWIDARWKANPPSLRDVFNVTATLMHLAASTWGSLIPADIPGARVVLDEETFVRLASQAFQHAQPKWQA